MSYSHLKPFSRFFFPWQLRISWCGALCLTRGWVCNLLVKLLLGHIIAFAFQVQVQVQVDFATTVSRPIRLGVGHLFGPMTRFFLFLSYGRQLLCSYYIGRPVWREDKSLICSAVAQDRYPYITVSSDSSNLEASSPCLPSPGTGWPSYTHGFWVPFSSLLTTFWATVDVF
jgi:hypothetical protein